MVVRLCTFAEPWGEDFFFVPQSRILVPGANLNSAFFARGRSAAVRWAVVFAVSFGGLPLAALPVFAQEKAKEEVPDSPAQVLVKQARVKIAEGQLDAAVQLCDQALALEANQPGAIVTKGMVHSAKRQFTEALAEYEKVSSLPGREPVKLLAKADAFTQKSRTLLQKGEALIHGNELLASKVSGYDKTKIMKQSDHTVDNIIAAVTHFAPPDVARQMLLRLSEYMVFDALIGNTDRHHENWGFRFKLTQLAGSYPLSIAPSFDHASSLGRECLDERCEKILRENKVAEYVRAGRGGVYWQASDAKGASPLKLVELASAKYPKFFAPALDKLCKLNEDDAWQIISRIPAHRASDVSKQLAHAIVCFSLTELRRLRT